MRKVTLGCENEVTVFTTVNVARLFHWIIIIFQHIPDHNAAFIPSWH